MCIDMYKTFAPIKRTTFSMVMAVVELTALMTGEHVDKVCEFAASKRQYHRGAVMETMLDLLDLYVQHPKSTKLGAQFDLNDIINIKIRLNNDLDRAFQPRHLFFCNKCEVEDPKPPPTPIAPPSPSTNGSTSGDASKKPADVTTRFIFNPDSARLERETASAYFKEEFEEYEIEVDEPVPPPPQKHEGGRGGYHGHGHRDRGDHRRGGYGGYRGERHYRGRGRHY